MTAQTLPEEGQRIRLLSMPSDPRPIPVGTCGTVEKIIHDPFNGRHQIVVDWDTERSLMLIAGVDKFEILQSFDVRLSQVAAFNRYQIDIEAADIDEACMKARNLVLDPNVEPETYVDADDELPFVHTVYHEDGEELPVPAAHDEIAVNCQNAFELMEATANSVHLIESFHRDCEAAEHTDLDAVWTLLHGVVDKLRPLLNHEQQTQLKVLGQAHAKELADETERVEAQNKLDLDVITGGILAGGLADNDDGAI